MYLKPVGCNEVIKYFKNKASLLTKIGPLKLANESFSLTETMANLICEQGMFPWSLKLAKIIPIYKDGSKTDVEN